MFLVRKNSTNKENEKLKTQRFKLENLSAVGQDEGELGKMIKDHRLMGNNPNQEKGNSKS